VPAPDFDPHSPTFTDMTIPGSPCLPPFVLRTSQPRGEMSKDVSGREMPSVAGGTGAGALSSSARERRARARSAQRGSRDPEVERAPGVFPDRAPGGSRSAR